MFVRNHILTKLTERLTPFSCGFILGSAFMASPAIAVFLTIFFILYLIWRWK